MTVISVFNSVLLEGNLVWVQKDVLTIKINFWLHLKVFQLVQNLGCKSESMAQLFRDIKIVGLICQRMWTEQRDRKVRVE